MHNNADIDLIKREDIGHEISALENISGTTSQWPSSVELFFIINSNNGCNYVISIK